MTRIGVLALQGAFREHVEMFAALGAEVSLVKQPEQLAALDAIVLPGGESTTQDKLLTSSELREPLTGALRSGLACFATCAGLILLATEVLDGRVDQQPLGLLDVSVRRNGYGRQVDSFEADLEIAGLEAVSAGTSGSTAFRGVFIRAPRIERVGAVDTLAVHDGTAVVVRDGAIWGATFHPELSHDPRVHAAFLAHVSQGGSAR